MPYRVYRVRRAPFAPFVERLRYAAYHAVTAVPRLRFGIRYRTVLPHLMPYRDFGLIKVWLTFTAFCTTPLPVRYNVLNAFAASLPFVLIPYRYVTTARSPAVPAPNEFLPLCSVYWIGLPFAWCVDYPDADLMRTRTRLLPVTVLPDCCWIHHWITVVPFCDMAVRLPRWRSCYCTRTLLPTFTCRGRSRFVHTATYAVTHSTRTLHRLLPGLLPLRS